MAAGFRQWRPRASACERAAEEIPPLECGNGPDQRPALRIYPDCWRQSSTTVARRQHFGRICADAEESIVSAAVRRRTFMPVDSERGPHEEAVAGRRLGGRDRGCRRRRCEGRGYWRYDIS